MSCSDEVLRAENFRNEAAAIALPHIAIQEKRNKLEMSGVNTPDISISDLNTLELCTLPIPLLEEASGECDYTIKEVEFTSEKLGIHYKYKEDQNQLAPPKVMRNALVFCVSGGSKILMIIQRLA